MIISEPFSGPCFVVVFFILIGVVANTLNTHIESSMKKILFFIVMNLFF